MPTMIFVNLPVKDLERSKAFYTAIGYSINPQFSDENAGNVVISHTIYLMLLIETNSNTFTTKTLVDASTATEAILALSADSRGGGRRAGRHGRRGRRGAGEGAAGPRLHVQPQLRRPGRAPGPSALHIVPTLCWC